jgi:hypothetical protein
MWPAITHSLFYTCCGRRLLLHLLLLPHSIGLLLLLLVLLLLQLISCKLLHNNIRCWPDRLVHWEHGLNDGRRFERPPARHARVHIFQEVVRMPCRSKRHMQSNGQAVSS